MTGWPAYNRFDFSTFRIFNISNMKKKYWQSFGELNQTDAFRKSTENEFKEEPFPFGRPDDKGILDGRLPRRDFKYLIQHSRCLCSQL